MAALIAQDRPGTLPLELWGHAFVHPLLEEANVVLRPGSIAGHGSSFKSRINRFSLGFHIGVRRKVEAELLHRGHIRIVTEQWANIFRKAESHQKPPTVIGCPDKNNKR